MGRFYKALNSDLITIQGQLKNLAAQNGITDRGATGVH